MTNKTSVLMALAAMSLAGTAYAADDSANVSGSVKYHNDGSMDATSKSSQTDTAGTATTTKDTANTSVDSKGLTTKKAKHHATKDPKGLMNKKTADSDSKVTEKTNGGYKSTQTQSTTDAAGTNTSSKTTKDVDVDNNGNVTSTETTKDTVDPKGLMNKTTSTHTTKTVNGEVVDDSSK